MLIQQREKLKGEGLRSSIIDGELRLLRTPSEFLDLLHFADGFLIIGR